MKKLTKKMKGKKVLSLVLAAIMLATTFNIALPMLKLDASAAGSITTSDGTNEIVTQTQIVKDTTIYDEYASVYLNGAGHSTGIVIPGLDPAEDYTIQGMTYYPERDWMLVTAYHSVTDDEISNGTVVKSSKVFALDAATGEFVAMFSFKDVDGTDNTDHGGGIAVSEHNIYYSCGDKDQKIAYAPLSVLENAPIGKHTVIQLVDEIVLYELGDSYTAYVCYDEGVLWAGNFYDKGTKIAGLIEIAAGYNSPANAEFNSMVFGYKLAGNSSEEEWDYLKGKFQNLLEVATGSGSGSSNDSTCSWTAYKNSGSVNVAGTVTAPSAYVGEFTGNFGSFTLTEGVSYTIEFTSNYRNTDLYMFSPAGTHCNVKQSSQTTITEDEHGRYHFEMNFTAGLKPTNADSTWPTTQSTDGTYTGNYTLRFDQDAIQAGESREFEITNIKISQTNTYENAQEKVYDEGSAGSPTYAIGLNNALKDVQYAVVDNGKLYLSRSYGSGAGNSVIFGFGDSSWLSIADMDLSQPGTKDITIKYDSYGNTKPIKAYEIASYKDYQMMPMSEGLCVVNDNIFITFESASNKYLNESGTGTITNITNINTDITNCEKPVDVIWQLDPYALMELEIPEPENSIYYEKVSSLEEIEDGEEYLILYKSEEIDPVTQQNILYAINADGGLKEHKLSKSDITTVNGYNAMVGHPITEYAIVRAGEADSVGNIANKDRIYLDNTEKDDVDNVRWTLDEIGEKRYSIKTTESYYANCNSLYFDQSKIGMAPSNATYLNNMAIQESGNGNGGFWISNAESYYLWCNDGLSETYNQKITSFYIENGAATAVYSGVDELDGTFHCDAMNTTNIIGQRIQDENDRVFYIYKRVKDDVASTYESRIFTDLNAELQADGTYTIDLETYAISPNHYQYVGERPTDYIIVADTSSSMTTSGSAGLISYTDTLSVNSFIASKEIVNQETQNQVNGYAFSLPEEELYYMHTDGGYYQLKLAIHTYELEGMFGKNDQRYWAYYVTDDGLHYILQNDGSVLGGFTYQDFINKVDNGTDYTKQTNTNRFGDYNAGTRYEIGLLNCTHYRFTDDGDEFTRFQTLQATVERVSDQIISQNSQNRIACVKYGADDQTAYFSKGTGNWATSVPTSDVNAFYDATELSGAVVASILDSTSVQNNNDGIELKIASEIVKNSGIDYTDKGERNLAVIFITDGVPGADGTTDASTLKGAANKVISYASEIKKAGGFIYTIVMGQDDTFDRTTYLQAVSTTYAEATSMDVLGGRSVDGINYNLNLSSCNLKDYFDIGITAMKETSQNSAVGILNLDDSAVIRQELSNSFKFDNASYDAKLITGKFDAIGRFSFEKDEEKFIDAKTEGITVTPVDGVRCLTITGYNYAKEYIGNGKSGNKLRVRITGVVPNKDATIQNTPISNTDTTALYQNSDQMGKNIMFKQLPTNYFNITEYTYVLDYGVNLYDSDVNGTMLALDDGPDAQPKDSNGNITYSNATPNQLIEMTNSNQDLIYKMNPTSTGDEGYVLIQRPEGTYDWFKLNVVPASNVYYEEDRIATSGTSGKIEWTQTGTTEGVYRDVTVGEDVYGYDKHYDDASQQFSNNSYLKVDVTNEKDNTTSKKKSFTFTGTGFDLMSACGTNTGVLSVAVKDENGKRVKGFMVDTYYNDANVSTKLSQVPVVSWSGKYGTYTVDVAAIYVANAGGVPKSVAKNNLINTGLVMNSAEPADTADIAAILKSVGMEDMIADDMELVWFDDNSIFNGGTGVASTKKKTRSDETAEIVTLENYIDGFRVYNPLGTDQSAYEDSEKNAKYVNVLGNLMNKTGTVGSIAYIVGQNDTLTWADYETVGPQDELYLKNGASVSFSVTVDQIEKIMLGLRAVNGATKVTIANSANDAYKVENVSINSATEMYYDITKCFGTISGNDQAVTITVTNTGDKILAVNHIKHSGGDGSVGSGIVTRTNARSAAATQAQDSLFAPFTEDNLVDVQNSMNLPGVQGIVKNGVIIPLVEETDEVSGDNTAPDTGDDNTNEDTNTDSGEAGDFSIFSLLEMLISLIEKILYKAFGAGKMA